MKKYTYKNKICYYCREEIRPSKNIYMFQDYAFCTETCRYQIMKQCNFIK